MIERYDNGFADLTNTNMSYPCEYCQQGFNRLHNLFQICLEYFICRTCISYYKLSMDVVRGLKYVETRDEWKAAPWCESKIFFPFPLGFDDPEQDINTDYDR